MSYSPELYVHQMDSRAFAALNQFPKLVQLQETYSANFDEKAARYDLLSSALRLSDRQMPEIYQLLPPICEKLGIEVPELYYIKSKEVNAATFGSVNPCIYITSKMVEKMPLDLISTVLAHECGHIACRHCLYHSMAAQLINGIENSPLARIPGVRRYLTPSLVRALLFWDRCSELSADRAAALCDGGPEKTIQVLLKAEGYDINIDLDEYMRQAADLHNFADESKANEFIEQIMTQNETHPRLATRAYECQQWAESKQYQGILDGTYTAETISHKSSTEEKEVISGEMEWENSQTIGPEDLPQINAALNQVSTKLDRYTCQADKFDYAVSIGSGILAGIVDSVMFGDTRIRGNDISLSHEKVNHFIMEYAKANGFDRSRLKDAIGDLEGAFKVLQDNVWKGAQIGVSAKNHHLADLAHHPTPVGLLSALIVQFLRIGTFVNKEGEWHFLLVETHAEDVVNILTPAILTGVLNWLAAIGEKKIEEECGQELPKAIKTTAHLIATTPILIEIVKCANNWFGHLVSDMGGSKNTAGGGMGIPGVMLSLLHEISCLPILKDTNLPAIVNGLYTNQKMDLRHELSMCQTAGAQMIPVLFNEITVRMLYFAGRLGAEAAGPNGFKGVNWKNVIPFGNRTVDRMLTIASMTFTVADTADAAVRAAIESGGNWILFSGRFVSRFNYMGAGRAALAIIHEVSDEKKETQLLYEKMLLSQLKSQIFIQQFVEFKEKLEEKVCNYLAEDIETFMSGFDDMNQGLAAGDSDLFIRGNVTIQKVLGRKPQFENQEEFDALMDSDIPLQL